LLDRRVSGATENARPDIARLDDVSICEYLLITSFFLLHAMLYELYLADRNGVLRHLCIPQRFTESRMSARHQCEASTCSAMRHNWQQSSEADVAAAVADFDAADVVTAGTGA